MKTGRRLPPLDARFRPFAGLGAARTLPRSAKALATNRQVYTRAIESSGTSPMELAWLAQDRIPMGKPGEGLFSRTFLLKYFEAPGAVVNSSNGKPATLHEKSEMIARLLQWQMNNKRHPPLERPTTTYYGRDSAAWSKFATGIAAAALTMVGAHYLGNAVMGGTAASTGATAAGATATEAAAAGVAAETAIAAGAAPAVAAEAAAAGAIAAGATPAAAAAAGQVASGALITNATLATAAKIAIPIIAATTGVPIPASLADGSAATIATDLAKNLAAQQMGRALTREQEQQMAEAVRRQQAALVESSPSASIPTVNQNLSPAEQAGQEKSARSSELVGWGILITLGLAALG